jgi:hypothetical protein
MLPKKSTIFLIFNGFLETGSTNDKRRRDSTNVLNRVELRLQQGEGHILIHHYKLVRVTNMVFNFGLREFWDTLC